MRALDHAAAHIHGGNMPLLYAEVLDARARAHNIRDRVDRPNLVEVNLLDRDIVNFRLGRAEKLKRLDSAAFHPFRERGFADELADHRQ